MEESHFKTQYDEHGVKLLGEIFKWFVQKTLPDVVLHVENRPIEAHKLILGASSTFFKSIFCTRDRKDLYFEDINYRTMKAIVEYMYTGELVVEWELMPECLKLADCLMIRGLSKLYCDKVVKEPAPVSEEMLEAIVAIGQTRRCSAISQQNDSAQVSEGSEDSWQKQLNLPKLQLKRDTKTGNWIPKLDELTTDPNNNRKAKPTVKRKHTETGAKETKFLKNTHQAQDFEHNSIENFNTQFNSMIDQRDFKEDFPLLQSPINGNKFCTQSVLAMDTDSKQAISTKSPEQDQNFETNNNFQAEVNPTVNASHYLCEQDFPSVPCTTLNNDIPSNANVKSVKNKTAQRTPSTAAPHSSNQASKKRIPELNGKLTAPHKSARSSLTSSAKGPLDTAIKVETTETPSKTKEEKTPTVRKSKQKQKSGPPLSTTASKATDLLIKKLFCKQSAQRNPAGQQNNPKSPKQSATLPNSTNSSKNSTPLSNAITSSISSNLNSCPIKEETFENDKVIKSEPNEAPNAKSLNRLAGRCKVSDWHIDESEVLECDEEYEQHKNAPCPQPAEFLKTEKLVYGCPSCNKAYTLKSNYRRHYVVTHRRQDMPVYKCPICDSRFTRTDNRNSHIRKIHDFADPLAVQAWNQPFHMCALCKKGFYNDNDLQNHLKTAHPPSRNSYCGRIT